MARLLFLGASVTQTSALRYARGRGHQLIVVDGDPHAVAASLADAFEPVDFSDLGEVAAVGARYDVQGVLAVGSDRAVYPAAAVAHTLSLPGIGSGVARVMTDKGLMREALASAGVRQPSYHLLEWPDTRAGRSGYPAVLKPCDSGGQRGVFLIRDADDLKRRVRESLEFSSTRRAILEQFIDGTELNALVVVRNGDPTLVILSDRLRPGGRAFGVGWVHSFPSSLDEQALTAARELAFAAVSAVGLRNGIAFPQLIVDKHGDAWLIEIAARVPAGQMAELVQHATGINLYEVAIRHALGLTIPDKLLAPAFTRPVVIRFFTADPGVLPLGTITAIEGLDAVRSSPSVLAADFYYQPGHIIQPVQVDADRSGYVIATGSTPREALAHADAAAERLTISTE